MRVCLVTKELAPYSGWGVGTYAANMAAALMEAGDEVHVLTNEGQNVRRGPSHAHRGAEVHTFSMSHTLRHMPTRASDRPLAILQHLRELHAEHDFDLIEFSDVWGDGFHTIQAKRTLGEFESATLAVRLHSPIFLLRDINQQHTLRLEASLVEFMEAEAIRGADVVFAPSQAIADKITAMLGGRIKADWRDEPTEVHHLANPFDSRLVYREPPKPAPRAGPRLILAYGRLEYRKGFHLLMDAAIRLLDEGRDIEVHVHGADTRTWPGRRSVRDQLERLVPDRYADRFSIEDNIPRDQLAEVVVSSTVCCFPSLWENAPYACIEAMALGALVVGSDAGGMAEIIEHDRSGLLFRAGDVDHLTKTLDRALTTDSLQTRAADLGPKRVRDIANPSHIVKRLREIVGDVKEPVVLAADEPGQTVAVLIPHKDMHETLEATIRSARDQSRPADEIIIVDDGSETTESVALLDALEREPDLTVIRQANTGLAGARNAAVAAAGSDYVIPLDADDLLAPDFIERALTAVSREPTLDMVTTLMACFKRLPQDPEFGFAPVGFDRDSLVICNVASSCTALIRRSSLLAAGGYDETLTAYEDWDLYCAMATRGMHCALIPQHLVFNRIRPGSMVRSLDPEANHALHASILAKHPNLAAHPDRALRLMLSDLVRARRPREPSPAKVEQAARHVIETKPEYRLADKAATIARRSPLAPVFKAIARRFIRE